MDDSPDRLAGERLWVGIPGTQLDEETRRHLTAIQPGGVTLFRRNLESPAQLAGLIRELRASSPGPVWISIDHEGGRVDRFPRNEAFRDAITHFPGNDAIARISAAEPETARELSEGQAFRAGCELRALGIDVNFAPVADVAFIENPILDQRTFGDQPARVAQLVRAAVAGYLAAGILPVAKHFPGLGGAEADPHVALCRLRGAFDPHALLPFQAGIDAGVPIVMTTHLTVEEFGEQPATHNRNLVDALLRRRLAFDGAVITDSLEMEGIAACAPIESCVEWAVGSSHDLLCIGVDDFDMQRRAHETLRSAYRSGEAWLVPEASAAARRIRDLPRLSPQPAPAEASAELLRRIREKDPLGEA